MGRNWVVWATVGWLGLVGATVFEIWHYSVTAAPVTRAPVRWPADAALAAPGHAELVLFVHPKCLCTVSTLRELAKLQGTRGRVDAVVWFMVPDAQSAAFAYGSSWTIASRIPRTEVRIDPAAAEAKRFGAVGSGAVLFYDAQGLLAFNGGITPSRGHEGDSPGRRELLALLEGKEAPSGTSPLYGCTLSESEP